MIATTRTTPMATREDVEDNCYFYFYFYFNFISFSYSLTIVFHSYRQ